MTESRRKPNRQRAEPLKGTYSGHYRGFGFFVPERGGDDLFVPPGREGDAIDGDTVLVERAGGDTARVVKTLERGRRLLAGTYLGQGAFNPDAHHVGRILKVDGKADRGDKVLVAADVDRFRIERVLGRSGAPDVEDAAVLAELEICPDFPQAALNDAKALRPPRESDTAQRLDLRKALTVVTIDPVSSRDFDDAVSLHRQGDGWLLGVHIADVSHYVRPSSALDREAFRRSTSVYLPGRVLPMLPEHLSNDLCSLREGQDRLTLSVLMRCDATGRIRETTFAETIIRPDRRFSYERASRVMDGSRREAGPFGSLLQDLLGLAGRLKKQRRSLDLPRDDTELVFDANGNIVDLRSTAQDVAHGVIEEFMLAANREVARLMLTRAQPVLFRHHPKPADLTHLWDTLALLGLDAPAKMGLRRALAKAVNDGHGPAAASAVFRCMPRAFYTSTDATHYSLGFEAYCHFTSPIRRYTDLLVHRRLRHLLRQDGGKVVLAADAKCGPPMRDPELENKAKHLNARAAAAERAESRIRRRRILEFLLRQGPIPTNGQITGVVEKGLMVDLGEYGVNGFLALDALPGDGYQFEPGRLSNSRNTLKLGQDISVRIHRIDPATSQLDLAPAPGF